MSKPVQSYDEALAALANGGRLLVHQNSYGGQPRPADWTVEEWSRWSPQLVSISDPHAFGRQIYALFAPVAEKHVKEFVCGPYHEWDGTGGHYYDGACFAFQRPAFMEALQHHRDEDGARYLWAFLTGWFCELKVVV